jgi:hypothetical protein
MTIGDTFTDGYGQKQMIIGETPRGNAWITISENGVRGFQWKEEKPCVCLDCDENLKEDNRTEFEKGTLEPIN